MNYEKETEIRELNSFKNEILKIIRGMESKLMEQINMHSINLSTKITDFDDKMQAFQKDNSSVKNLFIEQKLKLEKINEYERFQKKIDNMIITHDIRINRVTDQLDNIKSKVDKILFENLTVSGFIGPSCQYRNIGDYLSYNIKEMSKYKSEKDQMKFDINNNRQKMDIMHKNLITLIDAGVNRSNNYTNNRQEILNSSIEGKLEEMNNKIIDMKMRDIQTKIDIEKMYSEIKTYLEEIKIIKNKIEKNSFEEEEKNNKENDKENKKIRIKDRRKSTHLNENINTNEINNNKYNFNKIEMKKERKYSINMKSFKREKRIEKEETKEKRESKENLEEKIEEKVEEINHYKEGKIHNNKDEINEIEEAKNKQSIIEESNDLSLFII